MKSKLFLVVVGLLGLLFSSCDSHDSFDKTATSFSDTQLESDSSVLYSSIISSFSETQSESSDSISSGSDILSSSDAQSENSSSTLSSSVVSSFPVALEDFYFVLTWGIQKDSSYDSRTGTLIKSKYVRERQPEEYIATYQYPNINEIYEMAKSIDIYSYADDYYPYEGYSLMTTPSMDYVFEINDKTITSENCPISFGIPDEVTERGKQYLTLIFAITNTLTNSEEWKAMPDSEIMYM